MPTVAPQKIMQNEVCCSISPEYTNLERVRLSYILILLSTKSPRTYTPLSLFSCSFQHSPLSKTIPRKFAHLEFLIWSTTIFISNMVRSPTFFFFSEHSIDTHLNFFRGCILSLFMEKQSSNSFACLFDSNRFSQIFNLTKSDTLRNKIYCVIVLSIKRQMSLIIIEPLMMQIISIIILPLG